MTYTSETVEAFSRWAAKKDGDYSGAAPTGFTLAAAIELACRRQIVERAAACALIDKWGETHEELRHAQRLFACATECGISETGDAVWLTLPHAKSTAEDAHAMFLRRFTDALKAAGFSVDLAYALAGALEGMTDNLVQHCFDDLHRRGGVAAFRIRPRGMAFAVADLGRGALASLRENPHWQSLDSDYSAIRAIVTQHASRRTGLGDGEGFKTLFKALASLNGELRFRSGLATYSIMGTLDAVHGTAAFDCPLPGLFLSARCRLS